MVICSRTSVGRGVGGSDSWLLATVVGLMVSILLDLPTTAKILVFRSVLAGVESLAGTALTR